MYCGVPEQDPDRLAALILTDKISFYTDTNKALPELNDSEQIAALCSALNVPAFYFVDSAETMPYPTFLSADKLIVDTIDHVESTLSGLLSFYLKYPQTDVLLLASDGIQLKAEVLKQLADTYDVVNIAHDIVVYQHADGSIEPVPGIYTAEALKKIYWLFISGDLKKHSLTYCIEISNSFFMPIDKTHSGQIYN